MIRIFAYALSVASALLAAIPAHAQMYSTRPGWSDGWGWGWGWGHMLSGGLMMILFWGGIILVIVFAVRALGGSASQTDLTPTGRKRPLDILQERFARGEIDKQEYEERSRLLSD